MTFAKSAFAALSRKRRGTGTFSIQGYNFYIMETGSKNLIDLAALQEEAARFAGTLAPTGAGAVLVTLSGELGAGKTSFAQGVAKAFGIVEDVTSPTFVLEKIYEIPEGKSAFKRLVHIDAYRLEGERALTPLGFDELMQDAQNLILLEWPERVAQELPTAHTHITLAVAGEGRTIFYA
jgi:tRNA threonylcarbamoyladenosine biosynthesis protein TsaE